MKVTLREKQLANGRNRLYLDFYPPIANPDNGKQTRREFLELYTIDKPKNEFDKQHNKETKKLAEAVRAKRQIDIQNQNYGFLSDDRSKADFLEYFKKIAEEYKSTRNKDKNNYISVYNYLEKFSNGVCRFKDVTPTFCSNFKEFLQKSPTFALTKKKLANNSAVGYFTIFKSVVKRAYEKGLFKENPVARVKAIQKKDTRREFLTLEELQALARTDCDIALLKNACLFSALTGLRYSDIENLTWADVQSSGKEYYLRFKQQKTKGEETLPISKQAYELLGEPQPPTEKVFAGLLYSSWQNMKIQQWAYKAGITKTITFHCFRHTYATLQLSLGTDIYTVSKMLGHRSLSTTQVYAKIIDKAKREAADKITLDL